ncbi:hypothetical protein H5410_041748 [Solanum commersonii]|uniref:Uncharacterized protein n=1 Tax=Solanum commersonii TaxID=4109 RepID=A0A9J5XU00_SOLCO|nr:hypothetical protein H5410_041748 [Solanum commersonii]
MDVCYDLSNGVSWSQGANRLIIKLKRATKQLVPRGKQGNFQAQTSLKEEKTISYRYFCAIVHGFFVIWNFGLFLPKFFIDVLQHLNNGVSWSQGTNKHIFKFKRAPK